MSNIEFLAVIKFLIKLGKIVSSAVSAVYGENCTSKTIVYMWNSLLKQGKQSFDGN